MYPEIVETDRVPIRMSRCVSRGLFGIESERELVPGH